MLFRSIVIEANQPLGTPVALGQTQRGRGKQDRSPVQAYLRICPEWQVNRRRSAAQVAERAEVKIQPRVGWEQRAQSLDRSGSGNHQAEVCSRPVRVLLEADEEKSFVLANWAAHGESGKVVDEDRFGRAIQLVEIRDGIEALRLIPPEQRAVKAVGPGLGDHVEDAAGGSSEFHAEVSGLHRDFFHGVRNVERLSDTRKGDVVVLGSVQQKIIAAGPLAVYRKLYSRSSALQCGGAGWLDYAGQRACQRERIQVRKGQLTNLAWQKVPAAQRPVPYGHRFGFRAHLDGNRLVAHFETGIDHCRAIGFHSEPRGKKSLEAGMRDLELVRAEVHGVEPVDAGFVARPGSVHAGGSVGEREASTGYNGPRRVRDSPACGASARLSLRGDG